MSYNIDLTADPGPAPIGEIWKQVPGYPSLEISNYGRARVLVGMSNGKRGYPRLGISGCRKNVHNWVAELFIGPRPEGMVVDHIDGNKGNGRADNLQYITQAENTRKSKHTRLNWDKVRAIRRDFPTSGTTKAEYGRMYGVNGHQIGVVLANKAWRE